MPDLNPAIFPAGFPKKRRGPEKSSGSKALKTEMIKGWIIHKQTAFAPRVVFLEHTHSTQRWSLPVPIALAHLPNGLRAEPSQNISKFVPKVARSPSFSATVSLKFLYKVGCSPWFLYDFKYVFKAWLASGRALNKVAELMVPVNTLL